MEPHQRRHGPAGYVDYESYRPWLRDEFFFRCVYCLLREKWYPDKVAFNIDHFTPVTFAPELTNHYANLIYACARCNSAKSGISGIADPCQVAFGECMAVRDSGNIDPLNALGAKLCETLKLNSPTRVEFRGRWIRLLAGLSNDNSGLYREYMGFPTDLEDLRLLRPPNNNLPNSVHDCFFAQREQGRLAEVY